MLLNLPPSSSFLEGRTFRASLSDSANSVPGVARFRVSQSYYHFPSFGQTRREILPLRELAINSARLTRCSTVNFPLGQRCWQRQRAAEINSCIPQCEQLRKKNTNIASWRLIALGPIPALASAGAPGKHCVPAFSIELVAKLCPSFIKAVFCRRLLRREAFVVPRRTC